MNVEKKNIRYYRPDENSLMVWLGEDGLINVDFGTELVTAENILWSIKQHRDLAPVGKTGVLVSAQSSTRVDSDIVKVTTSVEAENQVKGMAIVPTATIGWVMTKLYLKFVKASYPTKAFNNSKDARDWLLSL